MKVIDINEMTFALSHEDALAAYVAISAVGSQLRDEDRNGLAGALYPIHNALREFLYPEVDDG